MITTGRCPIIDINTFVASIKLDSFHVIASERKEMVERIKALQPDTSNRQIAKMLGVKETTVRRDTATNVAPTSVSGAKAAQMVDSKERKNELKEEKQQQRADREQALGGKIVALPDKRYGVILTDPEWKFEFYSVDKIEQRGGPPLTSVRSLVCIDTPLNGYRC